MVSCKACGDRDGEDGLQQASAIIIANQVHDAPLDPVLLLGIEFVHSWIIRTILLWTEECW